MAGVTYNTNVTTGISLTNPNTQNPATIDPGVTITNIGAANNGDAIYGASGTGWTVVNLGTVSATAAAGVGIALASGGLVTNGTQGGASALISSNFIGVDIAAAFGTVNNYSTIASTGATSGDAAVVLGGGGIISNSGSIIATGVGTGGAGGIGVTVESQNGGNVSNAAGGLIQGYQNGVDFIGQFGTVINSGTVRDTSTGNFAAIYMNTGGLITNGATNNTTALITGPTRAIQFNNTAPAGQSVGTIVNFGTIASAPTGTIGAGIELDFGGLVVNGATNATTALIASTRTALQFSTFSTTLSNLGTIADTGGSGAAVYVGAGGSITNGLYFVDSGALISSAGVAISIRNGSANVTNFGQIVSTGAGFAGVYTNAGGLLTNAGRAAIAAVGDAFMAAAVAANVANDGSIASIGSLASAVYLAHGGTVTNGATLGNASISSNASAIFAKNGFALVDNLGFLADNGTTGAAIYLGDGGVVVNSNSKNAGVINSGGIDITTRGQFATVVNSGVVYSSATGSGGAGVYMSAGGIITNSDVIAGKSSAIRAINVGTTLTASVTLNNTALINSTGINGAAAVYFSAIANINNSGSITNSGAGAAMALNTVGTVLNNGTIAAAGSAAVQIGATGTAGSQAIVTLDNNKLISGKSGVIISLLDTGFNTLVNNGTITTTGGPAFAFGSGDDTLVVDPGSVMSGVVANFHPGSRIDFANQVGNAVSFSNVTDVLTLLNGNAVVNSLTLTGTFDPAQFAVASDGAGGTNVTLDQPPQLFAPAQFAGASFGVDVSAGGWTNQNIYPRLLADVNGDGMSDIVGFGAAGAYVALATGGGTFGSTIRGVANFGSDPTTGGGWTSQDAYPRELADVNGDGKADIVGFGAGGVYESLATGGGNFASATLAVSAFGQAGGWFSQNIYPRELADVNGDGKADIVAFGASGLYVSMNLGNGQFAQPVLALDAFGTSSGWSSQDQYPRALADVTGDGLPDIVGAGADGVWVSKNLGNGQFASPVLALSAFGAGGGWTSQDLYPRLLADVNGDGMADLVGFGAGGVWVAEATGNGAFAAPTLGFNEFGSAAQAGGWTSQNVDPRLLADINGDHKADIVGFGYAGVYSALSVAPTAGLGTAPT